LFIQIFSEGHCLRFHDLVDLTRNGLESLRIESWWGRGFLGFSTLVQSSSGGRLASYPTGTWSFPRGKAAQVWH